MSITTLSLYESLLKHDRPLAWWGLDTADPTVDDSGHGYTLTAIGGGPTNTASLVSHGDGGASGSRDFNGTTTAYLTDGQINVDTTEPPAYVDSGQVSVSSNIIPIPISAIQTDDICIVHMMHDTATATVTAAPAGWTQVSTTLNATTHATATYMLEPSADLTPDIYEWTWSSSASMRAVWGIWRPIDPLRTGGSILYDFGRQATAADDFHETTEQFSPPFGRAIVFWTSQSFGQIIPDATSPSEIRQDIDMLTDPGSFMRVGLLDYVIETAGNVKKSATSTTDTQHGATLITIGQDVVLSEDVLNNISETLSIHVLIRPDTVAAGTRTIIRKDESWGLNINGATVQFIYRDGGGVDRTITGPTVSASVVTHLVVVDDGTTIHFYKNGVETTAARTGTAGYTLNTNDIYIGVQDDAGVRTNWFDGRLDELAIWNQPLSDNMALAYYEAHNAGTFGTLLGHAARLPRYKLEIAWSSRPTDECLVWEDMTSYLRSSQPIKVTRGRSAELDRVETGTLNFVLKCNEREFDPNNTTGPFYPNIKPTKAVRLRAQTATDGVIWPRFFGYLHGWPQQRSVGGHDIIAVFTAADPLFALALDKVDGPKPRPAEYAGDRLQALIGDIPNIKLLLDAGQSELVAMDLNGVNRLEHAQAVTESDGGVLFAAGDGTITFQDRHHRAQSEQTVRATYGDSVAELPLEYQAPEEDEGHLFTAARVTDAFGRITEATNETAELEHFVRTKDVATMQTQEADAQAMAEAFSQRYSIPRERIREVRINPQTHTAPLTMYETAFGHEISHRIKTVERVGGDGSAISRELFVEGIIDTIAPSDWRITLATSPADLEGNFWILGVGELGDTSGVTTTALGW